LVPVPTGQGRAADRATSSAPSGGVQPARAGQLAQVVVDLAGRADPVQFGEFGGGAPAAEDLAEQAQPDRVAERGEGVGGRLPVAVQQVPGQRPVLPRVLLARRQPHGAGEQDASVGRPEFGQSLPESVQGPEVALAEAGRGPAGGLQGGQPALQVGDALFEIHVMDIT
jgi:hypothetical protein